MTSDLWRSVLPGDVVKLQGDIWIADGYAIVVVLEDNLCIREHTDMPMMCWGKLTDRSAGRVNTLWIDKYSVVGIADVPPTREALSTFAMLVMGHTLPTDVLDTILENRKHELTRTKQGNR